MSRPGAGRLFAAAFVLSLAAVVAGCAQKRPVPTATDPAAATAPAAAEPNGPTEAAPPAVAALPPQPEPPKPERPTVNDDPAQLLGLTRDGLGALLGQPNLIRREAPAEIWQYRGNGCILDVFLYEEGGQHKAVYSEARDHEARRTETRPCLNELLRAQLTS